MKRTLCLLLAVFLLVGVMAPAAMAQSDGNIRIICRNWSRDIPVTEFQFEYTGEGATLAEEPRFLYEDENGKLQRETGTLRNIRYELKFIFQIDDSFPYDHTEVTLNRNTAYSTGIGTEEDGSRRLEANFYVPVYKNVSRIRISPDELHPGGQLSGTGSCSGGINFDLAILQGDTPDAPVLPDNGTLTYELGQTYLFRFEIWPALNADIKDNFQMEFSGPLQYCPELTEVDTQTLPNTYTVYAKYECKNSQPIEVVQSPYGEVFLDTNGLHIDDAAYPGSLVEAAFLYMQDGPDYKFAKWEIEGVTLPEEQLQKRVIEFVMPDHPVKLTPVVEKYVFPYTDVDENDWFYDYVYFADLYDLTNGVKDTLFAPYNECTRAQFIAYIMRFYEFVEGGVTEEAELPFTDVPEDAWYYDYLRDAYALGLVAGKTETIFDPNARISRAEAVMMLWRGLGSQIDEEAPECPFADVNRDAYYYEAVRWCNAMGFVQGVSQTSFAPNQNTTRAEALTLLVRLFFT